LNAGDRNGAERKRLRHPQKMAEASGKEHNARESVRQTNAVIGGIARAFCPSYGESSLIPWP